MLPTATPTPTYVHTLMTVHPTLGTVLICTGGVVFISAVLMALSVILGKKLKRPRTPEQWDRSEMFLVSMFLLAWHQWAVCKHSASSFQDEDELPEAFSKYVSELFHSGAIDKHWDGKQLMQELLIYDERPLSHPFGLDTRHKAANIRRVLFADTYGRKLRQLFPDKQ